MKFKIYKKQTCDWGLTEEAPDLTNEKGTYYTLIDAIRGCWLHHDRIICDENDQPIDWAKVTVTYDPDS